MIRARRCEKCHQQMNSEVVRLELETNALHALRAATALDARTLDTIGAELIYDIEEDARKSLGINPSDDQERPAND